MLKNLIFFNGDCCNFFLPFAYVEEGPLAKAVTRRKFAQKHPMSRPAFVDHRAEHVGHARQDEEASRVGLALGQYVLAPRYGNLAHHLRLRGDLIHAPILKALGREACGVRCAA